MKIAVYAISKNEEQFVERFCDSVKDADCVIVADTGSTDNTASLLKERGVRVYDICVSPWRFDKARDAALALVPADVDVCISLDLDEVLEPGWREEIERVWVPGSTTRLRYLYDWGNGLPFFYEKIHARSGYHWHHPCHEYPRPDMRISETHATINKLLVSHKPDPTKSRGQYLDLLKMSVAEDPSCPRNAFYYARELTFYGKWQEATEALQNYLANPRATWASERAYAMRLLGKSYANLKDNQRAMEWFLKATEQAPSSREPWVDLAKELYRQSSWDKCHQAATRALQITDREFAYMTDPESWSSLPHDLLAISAYHTGRFEEAERHGKAALDYSPDDDRLKNNLRWYKQAQQKAA
jgi:tetratricopeptide (TPR) repeat protein